MIEEALRFDSPIQGVPRQVREPLSLADTELPKDAFLLVLLGSANRDDAQFPDAARFDIGRNPRGHMAFGFGAHFCLGAALARLEARVVFEELFRRCDAISLDEAEVPSLTAGLVRGPQRLPVSVSPV